MGKFIVKETEKTVHFNLVASNGEVIGSSQNYSTKDGCMNGIESVLKHATVRLFFLPRDIKQKLPAKTA